MNIKIPVLHHIMTNNVCQHLRDKLFEHLVVFHVAWNDRSCHDYILEEHLHDKFKDFLMIKNCLKVAFNGLFTWPDSESCSMGSVPIPFRLLSCCNAVGQEASLLPAFFRTTLARRFALRWDFFRDNRGQIWMISLLKVSSEKKEKIPEYTFVFKIQ